MERERLVAGERVQAGRARAVPDRHARRDRGRRGGDLGVRHAQQHGVRAARVGAAAQRADDLQARPAQRGGERGAEAARADDRARSEVDFDPVQFSHQRYRLVPGRW
jgi:hypothetical protein